MPIKTSQRWIKSVIAESEGLGPLLPWTRAAKRARRPQVVLASRPAMVPAGGPLIVY